MKLQTIVRTIRDGTFWQVSLSKVHHMVLPVSKFGLWLFCTLLVPIKKNKIVFFNFFGRGFGDNPKYIALELLKENKYDLVWLGNGESDPLPEGIRFVKFNSFKCYYELLTCKVRVENIRNYHPFKKRKGQIYLQTWHGGLGFKKVEGAAEQYLSPAYVKMAKYDGSVCDGIIADTSFHGNFFKNSFWLSPQTDIIRARLPRNEILFAHTHEQVKDVRRALNLDENAYVILYAPTFRDNGSTAAYDLDYVSLLSTFEIKKHKKCQLVIRMHPNVGKQKIQFTTDIVDGSKTADPMLLSIASDCIISDYSSYPFDFFFQNKPAYLYVNDEEEYKKSRNGFNELYDAAPFPKAYSQKELQTVIVKDTDSEMMSRYETFSKHCILYAGNSIKEWIENKIKGT